MDFKTKVVRGVASGAVVFLGSEAAFPHYPHPSECIQVGMTLCPAEEEFLEQRNEHVPHSEHDPSLPGAYRWIPSGEVNSTTNSAFSSVGRFTIGGKSIW